MCKGILQFFFFFFKHFKDFGYDTTTSSITSQESSSGGKIRIVKGLGYQARLNKEDFDTTLPSDVQEWLSGFMKTFNTFKKGPVVSQGIRMFFGTRNDLFEIVLKLYANTIPGNPKPGTFAYTCKFFLNFKPREFLIFFFVSSQ